MFHCWIEKLGIAFASVGGHQAITSTHFTFFFNNLGEHLKIPTYRLANKSIHNVNIIDQSVYGRTKMYHMMGYIAVELWLDHTQDHICAYNNLH